MSNTPWWAGVDGVDDNSMDVIVADPETRDKDDLQPPPKYVVVFLNDDYTPMDYVVELLQSVFGLNDATAYTIMKSVHESGRGVAGVFTKDIAETKAETCNARARIAGHPLKVVFEKE